jgi:hypothetical protein
MLKSGNKGAGLSGTVLLLPYQNCKTNLKKKKAAHFSQAEVVKV